MTGNLGVFSLADLLQLLSNSTQTGNLSIDHPEGEARVYFESGKIIHAELNNEIGEQAIKTLFTQEQGDFEFLATKNTFETSVERSINKNTDMLLLQVLGASEEKHLTKSSVKLPSLTVPFFVKDATQTIEQAIDQADSKLKLEPNELSILTLVDGQRTIQTLSIETGTHIDVIKTLVNRLIEAEVLSTTKPEIRIARLVVRLIETDLPHKTVAIDKKILKAWSKQLNYPISYIKCKHPDGPILKFKAEPGNKLGPYMDVAHDTLVKYKLLADMALLVKPSKNK